MTAGGLGYFSSLAMQLAWHLYASQVTFSSSVGDLRVAECFRQQQLFPQCLVYLMQPFVGLSLGLGLVCIWWNPKWQHKLSDHEGSLTGLNEYYLAQLALLGLRLVAWIVMLHVPLAPQIRTMLHTLFAVAVTVIAGWSFFGIIRIRPAPSVNWHLDPAPLLSSQQFVSPAAPLQEASQQTRDRAFSVENLAASFRPDFKPWRPPTPPAESGESMDWTPSQPTFQPELKQVRYKSADQTPFHGALPALNARG